MQGTLRVELLGVGRAGRDEIGLPCLASAQLARLLTTTWRHALAVCPTLDPDGQNGAPLFGESGGRVTIGDARPNPEIVAWFSHHAVKEPALTAAFWNEDGHVPIGTSFFAPLTLTGDSSDATRALLETLCGATRRVGDDGTPIRLSIRWTESPDADAEEGKPTGKDREPKTLLAAQRRLYRDRLRRLLTETAATVANTAQHLPDPALLRRLRQTLSTPEPWREVWKAWFADGNGAPAENLAPLRRALVGGNHLLTVLRLLPDLKQTPATGDRDFAEREAFRLAIREEIARRLWAEARESDELLTHFAASLLEMLERKARGEALPLPAPSPPPPPDVPDTAEEKPEEAAPVGDVSETTEAAVTSAEDETAAETAETIAAETEIPGETDSHEEGGSANG